MTRTKAMLEAQFETAVETIRQLLAAYAAADFDRMDQLTEAAGGWIRELDGEKTGDPLVNADEYAGEPAPTGEKEPAPDEASGIAVQIGGQDGVDRQPPARAFVALYNAARRLISQGPSASTMGELEAAVAAAERYVR